MLLCVPARIIHHARRIILRLPAELPSAPAFQAANTAIPSPAPATNSAADTAINATGTVDRGLGGGW
jgi:hypothetical protein